MSKNLYYALGLAVFAFLLMILSMMFTNFKFPKQSQGTLVFAETYKHGTELDKIIIRNSKETITLELRDNLWRVKEKGGYYAGTYLLNTLLNDFNTSVFFSKRKSTSQAIKDFHLNSPEKDKLNTGTQIEIYSGKDQLNSIILGKQTENGLYHFAKLKNQEIWLISGRFEMPQQAYSWMLQPILELPESLIETIRFYTDGKIATIGRKDASQKFTDTQGYTIRAQALTNVLERLIAEDVADKNTFSQKTFLLSRRMEIITFQGLVFYLDFYNNEHNEEWLHITLSTTPLPMSIVNDYIKDNKFLYEGWYFRLSPETSKILSPSSLI